MRTIPWLALIVSAPLFAYQVTGPVVEVTPSKIVVKKGETVKMGEPIAVVGATGNAQGVHLHFEYQNMNNIAMDPLPHLDRDFAH